MFADVVV